MYIYALIITALISFGIAMFILKKEDKQTVKNEKKKLMTKGDKIQSDGEAQSKKGMIFRFKCQNNEQKSVCNFQKGSEIIEKRNYGLFDVNVKMQKSEKTSIFEITHSHILPITVKCETKSRSRIFIEKGGYKISFLSGGNLYMVIIGAQKVRLFDDILYVTIKDSCIIATNIGYFPTKKDLLAVRELYNPPFLIETPNKSLDYYFNGWLWDTITHCNQKDFFSALLVAFIKNCYGDTQIKDFVKNSLFFADSKFKMAICLHLICDYATTNGYEIFDEKVGKITLRNAINRYVFDENKKERNKKESILRISAISRYSAFCDVENKLKILSLINKEQKETKITNQEILFGSENGLFIFFSEQCELAKNLLSAENISGGLNKVQKSNTLLHGNKCDFCSACIAYYYVVKKVLGVTFLGGEYKFSPRFSGVWEKVKLSAKKLGGRVQIELIPSEFDGVSAGGVKYSGTISGKVGKGSQNYKVYFKQ